MYLADYHTHSRISPDAFMPMTVMAEAAAAAGMEELCFTDHVEPIAWEPGRPALERYDWKALTAEFDAARAAIGGRIRLRLGIELGDAPWDFARTEQLLSQAPPLDFIIGSIHMLTDAFEIWDLSCFAPADERAAKAGIADYLGQVLRLARWGKFSVLGHLTLPLRYLNEKQGFHLTFDDFGAEVEEILRTLIQNGCGIELNTNRGSTPLPDATWLRLYRSLGGEIITLGSDAHTPDYVGCAIRERQKLLRQCGFSRFCTFDAMQPVFHEL